MRAPAWRAILPATMLVQAGEKLHVITRRGFDTDLRRHFAGLVVAVSEQLVRLDGYAFVYDINEFSGTN